MPLRPALLSLALLGLAFLSLPLGGCFKEGLPGVKPEGLAGDYLLVRTTGGFAGIDTSYAAEDSPQALHLGTDGSLRLTSAETTATGTWTLEGVVVQGDTLSGTFRETGAEVGFDGYRVELVADRLLYLDGPCCDFFNYTYLKR